MIIVFVILALIGFCLWVGVMEEIVKITKGWPQALAVSVFVICSTVILIVWGLYK